MEWITIFEGIAPARKGWIKNEINGEILSIRQQKLFNIYF